MYRVVFPKPSDPSTVYLELKSDNLWFCQIIVYQEIPSNLPWRWEPEFLNELRKAIILILQLRQAEPSSKSEVDPVETQIFTWLYRSFPELPWTIDRLERILLNRSLVVLECVGNVNKLGGYFLVISCGLPGNDLSQVIEAMKFRNLAPVVY